MIHHLSHTQYYNEPKELADGVFLNLDEVVSFLKRFSRSVDVISVDSNSTFVEATRIFNSYDIIVTPHGESSYERNSDAR